MSRFLSSVICAVLLSSLAVAAPAPASSAASIISSSVVSSVVASGSGVSTASAAGASPTVAYASDNPNDIMWNPDATADTAAEVQPIRGSLGATILGPQNIALQQQNPDLLAPPTTDSGTV